MNKNDIKKSFIESPDVLEKIKNNPRFTVDPKPQKKPFIYNHKYKLGFSLMVLLTLLIALNIGTQVSEQVYASTITIELNPSIEIQLDEDDLVMSITALNDDGEELIEQGFMYRRMNIDMVLRRLINRAVMLGYISTDDLDNILFIDVEGRNEVIKNRVLQHVRTQLDTEVRRHSNRVQILDRDQFQLNPEQRQHIQQRALELGITPAKLTYIYAIDNLDTNNQYTIEYLASLTMRDLYRIEQDLKNEE